MKEKILVDVRMLRNSGIGVYLQEILSDFSIKMYFDVEYIANKNVEGVKTYLVNSSIYTVTEQIEFFFKLPRASLCWSPHYNIPILPIRAKKRIVTIHDVYHLTYSHTLSAFKRMYARLMIAAAIRLSDEVITVSEFSKNEILKYIDCDPQKINVIHNGVRQIAQNLVDSSIINKYNISTKNYILFVGNVKPHKNLQSLLKAFIQLPIDLFAKYSVVLVGRKDGMITGDPDLFNWIGSVEGLSEKIIFTGHVDQQDLDTIYAGASLFVFPSYYEGFGLPPLEAMLNGCPVIASNAASIPEICGDAVLYFDPFDIDEMADKISIVLNDKGVASSLVALGKERIKLFTWEKSAELHKDLFCKVLNA